jgi:hypothetical protein
MNNHFSIFIAAIALLTTACQDTQRALGFKKSVPDAFRVVSQAPLSMPPEYHLLPPAPGAERPQQSRATDRAEEALVGQQERSNNSNSEGEQLFLQEAGANQTPEDIRRIIDEENRNVITEQEEEGFWDQMMDGTLLYDKEEENKAKDAVLDPVEEIERLQKSSSEDAKDLFDDAP